MRAFAQVKERAYDTAVARTLQLYENWILPCPKTGGFQAQTRVSLREAKLREFREKKSLLNPYERDALIGSSSQEERLRLEDLTKRTNFHNAQNFKVTYNRHEGAYGLRVRDFADSHDVKDSIMEWRNDPDAYSKFRPTRVNLKLICVGLFFTYHFM